MDRGWNIVEQVVEDPTTKLRLEFSSVHTEEVTGGRPAPAHDQIVYMRLWTTDRSRVATYAFTRGGQFIKTAVEYVAPGSHPPLDDGIAHARGEAMNYNEGYLQETGALEGLRPLDENGNVQAPELTELEKINYAKDFTSDM